MARKMMAQNKLFLPIAGHVSSRRIIPRIILTSNSWLRRRSFTQPSTEVHKALLPLAKPIVVLITAFALAQTTVPRGLLANSRQPASERLAQVSPKPQLIPPATEAPSTPAAPTVTTPTPVSTATANIGAPGANPESPKPSITPTVTPVAVAMQSLGWNKQKWGQWITSLAINSQGQVWIGTEGFGVIRWNPTAPAAQQWTQFTTGQGLGDNDVYALAVDQQGRVWCGHLNSGVSVFDGEKWKNYGVLDGPLGERVFDIAVAPRNGDVWLGTSTGLTRYQPQTDTWQTYTRAEGLPSDQIQAVACDNSGQVYAGTQADGLAIGTLADGYKNWRSVAGASRAPLKARERATPQLPSGLINDLLVTREGTVCVATTCGLASSRDGGRTWDWERGQDWADKVRGRPEGAPRGWTPEKGAALAEDYITCLAEDSAGFLWLGHWRKGLEAFNLLTQQRHLTNKVQTGATDFARVILPRREASPLVGWYGGGLVEVEPSALSPAPSLVTSPEPLTPPATLITPVIRLPLPLPAKPPTPAELSDLTKRISALEQKQMLQSGAYWGDDWTTIGDWVGRYGRQAAVLCGVMSPFDHDFLWDQAYRINRQIGPRYQKTDALRAWLHWAKTDKPRTLYNPILGYRRQAEWDDHGEVYPPSQEGPDIWIGVDLRPGMHRVSLYFYNKDGQGGANRQRDYLLELKPYAPTIVEAEALPALARARVMDFGGGVYKQFLVQGGRYYFKIARNHSFNTMCSAVFIDRLSGIGTRYDTRPLAWLGTVKYAPPEPPLPSGVATPVTPSAASATAASKSLPDKAMSDTTSLSHEVLRAQGLWTAVTLALDRPGIAAWQRPARLLAFRAAHSSGAPKALLSHWRWNLGLWTNADRDEFRTVMVQARQSQLKITPEIQGN